MPFSTSEAAVLRGRAEGRVVDEVRAMIESLHEQYLDAVFSYVLARVSNHAVAEDITAETFVAALSAYPRYRGESGHYAWLLGIARQKIAEAARRYERKQGRERLDVELSDLERERLSLALTADIRQLPEDAALQREAQGMARQLLDLLPEPQREALLLQVEEELPVSEIASLIGRTVTATYSLLQRARSTIFRLGNEYFNE
jgi:RNA polymerase sigma-70 factor (ECF subfamily)